MGDEGLTRRSLLASAAAGTAAAALPLPAFARRSGPVPPTADWPHPTRDLRGWRCAPEPVGPAAAERWRLTLAGGVPGAPAIVGDTVVAASYDGEVVAADLATGAERWRRSLPTASYGDSITVVGTRGQAFYAGPAVHRGRVLVASDRVWCLDLATGADVWSSVPLRSDDADDYFWGGVVVAGGLVLAGSGSGSELPRARGALTAYDVRDGALVWSTRTVPPGGNGGGVIFPPSVDERLGLAYVATGSPYAAIEGSNPGTSSLVAIDLAGGAIAWQDQVHAANTRGYDLNSTPVLCGRYAAVTAKDAVYGYDRQARTRLWERPLAPAEVVDGAGSGPQSGAEGGPLACDGTSYFTLANDPGRGVYVAAALDPATGAVRWQRDLPGVAFAAPALAGGVLWTASAAGLLHAVDTRDGRLLATRVLGAPSSGAPASAKGRLVVGTGAAPYLPGESLVCFG